VCKAAWLSPQVSFADLDSAWNNLLHLLDICIMCSLNFSLLSFIIPKYLNFCTCYSILLFIFVYWVVAAGLRSKAVPMRKLSPWTLRPVITFPLIIVRRLTSVSEWRLWGRYELFTCTVAWSPHPESLHLLLRINTSLPRGLEQEHRYDRPANRELLVDCVDLVDGGSGVLVWAWVKNLVYDLFF